MRIVHVSVELKFKLESSEGCQALGARGQLRGQGGYFQLRGWVAPSGARVCEQGPEGLFGCRYL